MGYAIRELYLGTATEDGAFHDVLRHTPDQEQTTTYCSSVDPWHQPSDLGSTKQAQVGFDLFYTSGVTRGLPAMMPIAMLYDTPDNAAAEIAYLEKRGYPISYVEMGEEADGQYMLPEDYAALYLQWATAIHRVDPELKLGGPSFQGVNKDIEVWPDANGKVSWTARFVDYLKQHGRMNDLAFFSFEHYPYDPCRTPWGMLYDEPELVSHIMQVWHEDGIPADMPMFITEGNLSSGASETYQDIFAGIWLADYIGSFLNSGGNGVYFFHYLPLQMEPGCNSSSGNIWNVYRRRNYQIQQPLAQFFVAQLINLEWVQPEAAEHQVFAAKSDLQDGAGHELVTAYAVKRPDGKWAVMAVNRDQQNAHRVRITFEGTAVKASTFAGSVEVSTFGSAQYQWHPAQTRFMAHAENSGERTIVPTTKGWADPDAPIVHATQDATKVAVYDLSAASVVVIRGKISGQSTLCCRAIRLCRFRWARKCRYGSLMRGIFDERGQTLCLVSSFFALIPRSWKSSDTTELEPEKISTPLSLRGILFRRSPEVLPFFSARRNKSLIASPRASEKLPSRRGASIPRWKDLSRASH